MEGTLPKGYEPKKVSKKTYKDHEVRNFILMALGAIGLVIGIFWAAGFFSWIHDMGVEIDQNKAQIEHDVEAETSCHNLKVFDDNWKEYWDKPYADKMVEKRMVELHC